MNVLDNLFKSSANGTLLSPKGIQYYNVNKSYPVFICTSYNYPLTQRTFYIHFLHPPILTLFVPQEYSPYIVYGHKHLFLQSSSNIYHSPFHIPMVRYHIHTIKVSLEVGHREKGLTNTIPSRNILIPSLFVSLFSRYVDRVLACEY